jgi:S-adenosylmethionine:tRNA ribosyltransferase-isomerase
MHGEWCELSTKASDLLNQTRTTGGRIVAVGTTTVRTLETSCRDGSFVPFSGTTNLFIRPPYRFGGVDCLLTNFHLPRSTLFVLVSSLAGLELMHRAYREAVREGYRFYSYGDAMLEEIREGEAPAEPPMASSVAEGSARASPSR